MADKSPKKPMAKKPGSTLKEKRAVKKEKRGDGPPQTLSGRSSKPGT